MSGLMKVDQIENSAGTGAPSFPFGLSVPTAGYTSTAGGAINNTPAVYKFPTKVYDTNNDYSTSTGLYTCPVAGKYRVSATISIAAVAMSTSEALQLYVFQNSTQKAVMSTFSNGTAQAYICSIEVVLSCAASDTISIKIQNSEATTVGTGSGINNLNIELISA